MPTSEVTCSLTAWVQIVRNDIRRVELRLANTHATARTDLAEHSDTPPGYPLFAVSELALLHADEQGAQSAWFCYSPTAAVTLRVYEGYGKTPGSRTRKLSASQESQAPPKVGGSPGGSGGGRTQVEIQ